MKQATSLPFTVDLSYVSWMLTAGESALFQQDKIKNK